MSFWSKKRNPLVKPENFYELPKPSEKSKGRKLKKKPNEDRHVEDLFQIDTQETSSENSDLSVA